MIFIDTIRNTDVKRNHTQTTANSCTHGVASCDGWQGLLLYDDTDCTGNQYSNKCMD